MMARKFKLERGYADGNIKKMSGEAMQLELKITQQEFDEKIERGTEFVDDKKSLESAVQMIEDSDLSAEDKKVQLMILREAVESLKEKYDEEVKQVIEEYESEYLEILRMAEDNLATVKKQTEQLENMKLESGAVDASQAIEASRQKEAYYNDFAREQSQQLKLRIEQMNMLEREMMRNKYKEN